MKWKLRLLVIMFVCVVLVLLQQDGLMYGRTVKNKIQELLINGVLIWRISAIKAFGAKICSECFRQCYNTEPVTQTKITHAYFDPSFTLKRGMVHTWTQTNSKQKACDTSLVLHGNRFNELHFVIIDTAYINRPFSKGGLTFKGAIKSHLDKQSTWTIRRGFWKLRCNDTKGLYVNDIAVPFYKSLSLIPKQTNDALSDSNAEENVMLPSFRTLYFDEFRDCYLQQNGLRNVFSLDCRKIKITLIIRRNYISRIGDRHGNAERTIFNEGEVLAALKTIIPESIVSGRIMDSAPMEDQLTWISETDILVGVHGAGMTHALFLPEHAEIFEIFPLYFKTKRPWYCVYEAVARWRSLTYKSWTNTNPKNEIEGGFIYIPVDSLIANVKELYRRICTKAEILT